MRVSDEARAETVVDLHLKMGELFAGYGGLGMGTHTALNRLGAEVETAWVCEFDEAPSKLLAQHWPDAPNLGDVTKVDFTKVERVDVLTGGFPCQDVSLAGRRAGMGAGTRSGLWSEFARAIDELRPGLVVIENVRGLLSARAGKVHDADLEYCPICVGDDDGSDLRALGAVLGDLAELGFDAEWGGVEASAVGAPHRRFRVFIVAWPRVRYAGHDAGRAELGVESAFAGRGLGEPGEGVADASRDSWGLGYGDVGHASDADGDLFRELARRAFAEESGTQKGDGVADSGGGSGVVNQFRTPCAAEAEGGPPEKSTHLMGRIAHTDFGDYALAVARWEAVLGRPAPPPTVTGPKGGARLSPAFVEWMMGLPEGHVVGRGLTRVQELRALGNGVVPQQAAAAELALLARVGGDLAALEGKVAAS